MARYLSGSPVLQSQRYLADTLRQGISDMGQRPLDMARFGLMEKQTLSDIAHRKRGDERADRRMELAELDDARKSTKLAQDIEVQNAQEEREVQKSAMLQKVHELGLAGRIKDQKEAEDAIRNLKEQGDLRNERVSLKGMFLHTLGPKPSRETMSDAIVDDKISQVLEITGGQISEEVNPETGLKEKYLKGPQGKYLTWGNYKGIQQAVNDVFLVGGNPVLRAKQRLREMEKLGTDGLPPEELQQYEALKKNVDNPRWQLAQLEKVQDLSIKQLGKYREMGKQTPTLDMKVLKRGKQIEALRGTISESAKQAGKERVEKIKLGKQTKGKVEKNADLYYGVYKDKGATKQDALKWAESLETKSQRISLANKLIDQLPMSLELDEYNDAVADILESQGLGPVRAVKPGGTGKPTGIQGEISGLLDEGRNAMAKQPQVSAGPERPAAMNPVQEIQPQQDMGNPAEWDVREQNGQFFLMTADGPIQMTPELIKQWQQAIK